MVKKEKIAVILFNLGGPDSPEAVKPFLFNLFNDKAIITLPQPLRWVIAKLISTKRAPVAQEIYKELGGASPLLPNTEDQAKALDQYLAEKLADSPDDTNSYEVKSFIAMRYWHPFAAETIDQVKDWEADRVLLLPLYPQFSTTTSESSIHDWKRNAVKKGFCKPTEAICCYATGDGFIKAVSALVKASLAEMKKNGITENIRVLYTAHGLPQKVVDAGDPYQWQVDQTSKAIASQVAETLAEFENSDWITCYQSRVGPLEWIKPYTEEEIKRAGQDHKSVLMVPIAFVSEHSETLVELDIEYGELAEECSIPHYYRVPTVNTHPDFIANLGNMVLERVKSEDSCFITSDQKKRICSEKFSRCICQN